MAQYKQVKTTLKEALEVKKGEVISLVGAGGKTSLMQALADELVSGGGTVVTTTTTKIFGRQSPSNCLIIEADENKMIKLLALALKDNKHITLASAKLPEKGKLDGISPQMIERIANLKKVDYIIIEADGAACKPLKAPNSTEPVIAKNTSLVVAIIGIECLNKKLNIENTFRPEIISDLTGLPMNAKITAETIATLLTNSNGIIKGSPPSARIIPFLNKVDSDKELGQAEEVARKILEARHPKIERVLLGRLQSEVPVVKIVQ